MTKRRADWTLRSKLLVAFLLAGVVPLLASGLISQRLASSALEDGAYSKLVAIKEAKRGEIDAYLRTIRDQVITLSANTQTVAAMKAFNSSFHNQFMLSGISDAEFTRYESELRAYYEQEFGLLPLLSW